MSMGIISVRVASDIPIQSEYLPLISLYFLLGMFYTFLAFRRNKVSNQEIKNEIEELIGILNYLTFAFMFVTMFVSYLTIWLIITS